MWEMEIWNDVYSWCIWEIEWTKYDIPEKGLVCTWNVEVCKIIQNKTLFEDNFCHFPLLRKQKVLENISAKVRNSSIEFGRRKDFRILRKLNLNSKHIDTSEVDTKVNAN